MQKEAARQLAAEQPRLQNSRQTNKALKKAAKQLAAEQLYWSGRWPNLFIQNVSVSQCQMPNTHQKDIPQEAKHEAETDKERGPYTVKINLKQNKQMQNM